jgi:hypothetical protein
MNKGLVIACAALLPSALWGGFQMTQPKTTLTEQWLLDRVPTQIPGYRLIPSLENPRVTYRMSEETYAELEPVGITAQVFEDADGRQYEAVVIAGQDMNTFHDQRVCFTTQGWSLTKNTEGHLVANDFGDVPILDLTVSKGDRQEAPAFFMWRSPARFTNNRRTAKFDFLKSGLLSQETQVGFSYRFMAVTDGVDASQLKKFTDAYLSALKQAEAAAKH